VEQAIPAGCVENPHVSYLRPDQIIEIENEIKVCEGKLRSPYIQDKGEVHEQLRRMQTQLETQAPKPYKAEEIDRAVRREAELRVGWQNGMLSQEEMRKSPAGAPDAHRNWEKRNKAKIFEWQNIMRRLHVGTDDTEVASIERFRPTASTMGMHDALIPGKQFFLPPAGAKPAVTFTDEQLAILKNINPEVAAMLATASNEQRAEIKQAISGIGIAATDKPKKVLSEEHKAKLAAGRAAYKAKKAA
jgi:hypothetical protein